MIDGKGLVLIAVLLTSGCVLCDGEYKDIPEEFGLCDGTVVLPATRDVINVEEIIYPSKKVRAGESVDFILKVGYTGDNPEEEVTANLFDVCNGASASPAEGTSLTEEIRSDLSQTYEWTVTMPAIVPADTVCSLHYLVNYREDEATAIEYVDVYSYDEYYQRLSRGDSVAPTGQTYESAGPIEIDIDTGDEAFIKSGTNAKKIYVTVKKVGKGMLEDSTIDSLTLTVPLHYTIEDGVDEPDRELSLSGVKVYGDTSERFSFDLRRDNSELIYEQIQLKAVAEYSYEYRGTAYVTIEP